MKTCEHTHFLAKNHKTRDRKGGHWHKSAIDQYLHRMDRRRIRHNAKQSILNGLSDFDDEKSDADADTFDNGIDNGLCALTNFDDSDKDDHNEREEQLRIQWEELYVQEMMELDELLGPIDESLSPYVPYNENDVYGHDYHLSDQRSL